MATNSESSTKRSYSNRVGLVAENLINGPCGLVGSAHRAPSSSLSGSGLDRAARMAIGLRVALLGFRIDRTRTNCTGARAFQSSGDASFAVN